uniref:AlNc14C273G9998 protein n=1 Tax=Albugo laibachii Nc14 TaxID=890382 RepID=F0WUI7_9STRA|nr:AlNc14C273G9998 [Albugo laibachii Nc14]|eukprot:CCA25068.1 AlNc14C273G9998 [Albugo laibachii Nc14]
MDDNMSATELRQRYHRGGVIQDSNLSAAQLRSRYAIPSNTFKEERHRTADTTMLAAFLVAIGLGSAAYIYFRYLY